MDVARFSEPRQILPDDDVASFSCGNVDIDAWLRDRAKRARTQGTAVTYVTFDEGGRLAGFYALSAVSVARHEVAGGWLRRNVPEDIPCVLLGMLEVDRRHHCQGLGSQLLRDATLRAIAASDVIGARALVVDPADDGAQRFYERYGFKALPGTERMYVPLARGR